MSNDGLIKVYVPGESMWAEPVADRPGTAILRNVPIEEGLFTHDVVQLGGDGRVLYILARKYKYKSLIEYTPNAETAFKALARRLMDRGLDAFEGFHAGIMGLCHDRELVEDDFEAAGVDEVTIHTTDKWFGLAVDEHDEA